MPARRMRDGLKLNHSETGTINPGLGIAEHVRLEYKIGTIALASSFAKS